MSSLPLFLVGHVNLIKMVILPKFLYLFQHIPICINTSFFTSLDSQLNAFIWDDKPARLKKSILQLPKSEGGLALPNLRHYYWASNINRLLYWTGPKTPNSSPPWVHMEISSSSSSLHSVICCQLPVMTHKISVNPIVTSTIKIWLQFRRQHGLHRASIQAPILNNHSFSPSCSDPTFRMWAANGLVTISNLYKDGVFSDFASLSAKYHLPNSHLFRFFQIRHFAQKQFPHFPNRPPESGIDQFLTLDCDPKRLVSTIYGKLASFDLASTTSIKESWEGELGLDISDSKWRDILRLVQTSSICARHGLMQCKVLHRAHFTNAKLAKIFPLRSDACNRCKQSPANHTHMFWSCPSLNAFWSSIFKTLEQALNPPVTFRVKLTRLKV